MPKKMRFIQPVIKAFGATNIGLRQKNEDYFLIDEKLRLFVVADGMGGHTAGNFASLFASGRILELFTMIGEMEKGYIETTIEAHGQGQAASCYLTPEKYINFSIWDANRKLARASLEAGAERPMGTTMVGAFFFGNKVYFFNVGDSRAYRIYRGTIQQVTTDHSLIEKRISKGELTPEDARYVKGRNVLTRAVGPKMRTEPDVYVLNSQIGDRYLLCSDGLSNIVVTHPGELPPYAIQSTDPETKLTMLDFVFKKNLKDVAFELVDLARERGGQDNITAVAIEVTKEGNNPLEFKTAALRHRDEDAENSIP